MTYCPQCGRQTVATRRYTANGKIKEVKFCIHPGCKARTYAKEVK